ncbi:MAG: FCD domain-containing protein [Paracoccus sp. (in: a-proteobacteria)]|nr:FCD domain-containing protein [Paracoccus sp. (in: a-proteobacteria)]
MALPPVETTPAYQRVARLLEAEIIAGRIAIGDLLPIEANLSAQLGVHRSTIREGLRALESAGLLRRVKGKRLMVTAPDPHGAAWAGTRAIGLAGPRFLDLWEVQMQTEPFAAGLAATRCDSTTLAALDANLSRMADNLADDDAIIAYDIEFHGLVAQATGNAALTLAVAPVNRLLFAATRDLFAALPQARQRMLDAHHHIVAAIRAGDAYHAQDWMARHIRDFRRGYQVAGLPLDRVVGIEASVATFIA